MLFLMTIKIKNKFLRDKDALGNLIKRRVILKLEFKTTQKKFV